MNFAAFFRNRVVGIVAASLAAVAIFILAFGPRTERPAAPPRVAVAPPAQPDSTPSILPAAIPFPTVPQATLQPMRPLRPAPDKDLASVFPPSRMPDVATAQGAAFSLSCLAKNGADLSKPMPSKHHVFAATEQVAAQLRAWAQANGFEVRNAEVLRDHVGTPRYGFDLVRVEVPVPAHIEREARMILEFVQNLPGAFYQTWSGEIVR